MHARNSKRSGQEKGVGKQSKAKAAAWQKGKCSRPGFVEKSKKEGMASIAMRGEETKKS